MFTQRCSKDMTCWPTGSVGRNRQCSPPSVRHIWVFLFLYEFMVWLIVNVPVPTFWRQFCGIKETYGKTTELFYFPWTASKPWIYSPLFVPVVDWHIVVIWWTHVSFMLFWVQLFTENMSVDGFKRFYSRAALTGEPTTLGIGGLIVCRSTPIYMFEEPHWMDGHHKPYQRSTPNDIWGRRLVHYDHYF